MKTKRTILNSLPEFVLIAISIIYWISSATLFNPVAIVLILVLAIQLILRNDILGVIIPFLMILTSIYLLLALLSEFNEFQVKGADACRLLLVGIPFILVNITSSVFMIRKYTK